MILLLAKGFNNADGGLCFLDNYIPPHCMGYEKGFVNAVEGFTVPCLCGDLSAKPVALIVTLMGFSIPMAWTPFIIFLSIFLIHRSVSKTERELKERRLEAVRTSF